MAKRRLSRQQKNRIQAAQDARSIDDRHPPGRVISHRGGQLLVEMESGDTLECRFKSNLGNIVCGDRVAVEKARAGDYRVTALLPRDNLLQRIDGNGRVRAIAANVSQLFVCLAAAPEPNLLLLDQYLVSAEQQQIEACILFNKIDLLPESIRDPFDLERIYTPLGYPLVRTSIKSGEGMDEFRAMLSGRVSVLSGVSGVGKSSLTNWLLPEIELKTASLSSATDEGRHTTRASRLYHLPDPGGDLIDTPGVRGFSPFVDTDRPLAHGFREILARGGDCRFHNCRHLNEPGCAVVAAAERGEIEATRYQNYLKLLDSERSN
jgi:ribosome biogenesis GTPase